MKYKQSVWTTFALISQLGISIIVPIFLCTFVGSFLEERFSISITVPMIILGVLAGARNAYVLAKQAIKELKEEDDEKKER